MTNSRKISKYIYFVLLGLVVLAAGTAYWWTAAASAYPGLTAKNICEAVGLAPSFTVGNVLWATVIRLIWAVTGDNFFVVINTIGVIFGAACLAIIGLLQKEAVFRVANIHFEPREAGIAGAIASIGAVLIMALNPAVWASANRFNPAILSVFTACAVLVLFRLLLIGLRSNMKVLLLWLLYGCLAVEIPFLILIAPVLFFYFVLKYAERETWLIAVLSALLAGLVGGAVGMTAKALWFAGSDSAELIGVSTILSSGWFVFRDIIRSLFAFFPRMGWLLQLSFYWVPLFAVLGALRKDSAFNFQEKGQVILHLVLTAVLFLAQVFSLFPPAYVIARSEVMIFSGLIHAVIVGYLCAYWFLFSGYTARQEKCPGFIRSTSMIWGFVPFVLMVFLVGFASRDIMYFADCRKAGVVDQYVEHIVQDLEGRDMVLTDGVVDHLILLKTARQERRPDLYNISLQNISLYMDYVISRCIDPDRKADAAIGLVPLFRSYLRAPSEAGRVAVTVRPQEVAEGNTDLVMIPKRTVYVPRKIENVDVDSVYAENSAFFSSGLQKELLALAQAKDPLSSLADWLVKQSSLMANDTGVLLAGERKYVQAWQCFEDSVSMFASNLSSIVNMKTLIHESKVVLSKEDAENFELRFAGVNDGLEGKSIPVVQMAANFGVLLCDQLSENLEWLAGSMGADASAGLQGRCSLPDCRFHREALAELSGAGKEGGVGDLYRALFAGGGRFSELFEEALPLLKGRDRTEAALLKALTDGREARFKEIYRDGKAAGDVDVRMLSSLAIAGINRPGMNKEIMEFLQGLLARESQADALVSFLKGREMAEAGRWREAARFFKYAVSRGRGGSLSVYIQGLLQAHIILDEKDEAVRIARQILLVDAKNMVANLAMGNFYLDKKKYDLAQVFYERALKQDARSIVALNNLAWILSKTGDLSGAERRALAALEIEGSNPSLLDTLGVIYMAQGEMEQAEQALTKAYELAEGSSTDISMHFAELLLKKGDRDRAAEILADVDEGGLSKENRRKLKDLRKSLR